MTAIDYDLEFLEDGRTIELISIGMVREDGTEYYAVNSEAPWDRIKESEWLFDNVVPTLPLIGTTGKSTSGSIARWFNIDFRATCVKPKQVIANEVRDFIQATPDAQLWADYGAYDHVALCQLWGSMMGLPAGVPMWTHDLQQEIERLGIDPADLPQQASGQHNALADARHNQVVRLWLAEQDESARFPARIVELTGGDNHAWDDCARCEHDRDHHREGRGDCEYEPTRNGTRCDCDGFGEETGS